MQYCDLHVCIYTCTKTGTPHTWVPGWGYGVLSLLIYPCFIFHRSASFRKTSGNLQAGPRIWPKPKQTMAWRKSPKIADLHYSHSQPQPPPSFQWKTSLLVPNQVFPPIIGALFFVVMWVLSIRQWHHKRHIGSRRNAFLFHKVYAIVPQSVTYSIVAYIHFGNVSVERWMC